MKNFGKLLAFLAIGSVLLTASAEAETRLRFSIWLPPSHPLVSDVLIPFAKEIETVTDNRVKVDVLPAALGSPPAHFDLAVNGVADITHGNQSYTPGRFKTSLIAEMPFLGNSAEAVSVAFWRTFDAILRDAGEYNQVKVLAVFTHGPGAIFTKDINVADIDNLKGQKIRVGGGIAHDVATTLEAVPVEGPAPKAYELLSQGVADGIFFPLESVKFFNLIPLLNEGMLIPGGLYNTAFFIVMNKQSWDNLPAEDRDAISTIIGEPLARKAGQMWDRIDGEARAAMQGKITVQTASEDETALLEKTLQPLIEETIQEISSSGIDGQAAYEMMKAEVAKETAR